MTPAHAYSYIHIFHIFDKFVHYATLCTRLASLEMRADCNHFHIHFAHHINNIITAVLLQEYEENVTIL